MTKECRSNSRLPELVDLFLSRPLVTVPLGAKLLKVTPKAIDLMLTQLGGARPRELTGRTRYRAWGIVCGLSGERVVAAADQRASHGRKADIPSLSVTLLCSPCILAFATFLGRPVIHFRLLSATLLRPVSLRQLWHGSCVGTPRCT
ncbi:helix-turn-helix domain-containing protein [Microvirga rosea]|uniref:helix-turn-helix domain-containing protein n=1 Tax=Microvirga rosea TaxID=2715425 RepID=UPI001D0ACE32|nr:helix-turn-helix domain-containing protein [Microvirga rosea]